VVHLGDEFEGEVGSEQLVARFAAKSPNTVVAALPYATAGWRNGNSTVRYRMTTIVPGTRTEDESQASGWLPAVSVQNGRLILERGLHQEVGWERRTETSDVAFLVYADRMNHPVLEAMTHAYGDAQFGGDALIDSATHLIRASGMSFFTSGVMGTVDHRLPGDSEIRVSFANGDALVMPATRRALPFNAVLASARPRRTTMYSISLSGTLDGTGTRWRASYRWQPEETVTRVAPFAGDAAEPFFNLHLRQPVNYRREGGRSVDVMVDVHNLLAQGFRPFVLTDGSVLMFAQDQRSVSGGFAFTF
jgi:hypothetical protein